MIELTDPRSPRLSVAKSVSALSKSTRKRGGGGRASVSSPTKCKEGAARQTSVETPHVPGNFFTLSYHCAKSATSHFAPDFISSELHFGVFVVVCTLCTPFVLCGRRRRRGHRRRRQEQCSRWRRWKPARVILQLESFRGKQCIFLAMLS